MKIAGFELSKKSVTIISIFAVIIVLIVVLSSINKKKEAQQRIEEQERLIQQAQTSGGEAQAYDVDASIQKSLVQKYGEPPEGFKWTVTGELEALSSEELSAEDVIHTYIRSLSILDFATAQRYSKSSKVYDKYMDYYDEIANAVVDYYDQFLRKQFTFAIKSIENLGIESNATTASGTQVVSVKMNLLDLTDKDFWRDDMQYIYQQMRIYGDNEDDDVKKEQFLYDYVYSKYEDGTIKKHEVVCDFKIEKQNNAGWLISDDSELCAYLSYDRGTDVAQYILNEYNDWLIDTTIEEQKEFLTKQQEEIKRQQESVQK